jgi:glycerophosphoryl diester phosphodiesterase
LNRKPANRFREAFARDLGRPLILAHRGDSAYAPENTLLAATLGHRNRADGWEFDVQLTKDGVPILLHDRSLGRTTDVELKFPDDPRSDLEYLASDFTLEEIRLLDAGGWFLANSNAMRTARAFRTSERLDPDVVARIASGLVKVPTLEEALILTERLDWSANVEIKSSHEGDFELVDKALSLIDRLGVAGRVQVSSFDHAEVARVAARSPGVATGVLATTPLFQPVTYVRDLVGADAYHISSLGLGTGGVSYLRGRSVEGLRMIDLADCRQAGLPVLVFTVNETGQTKMAGRLAKAEVAGLFTDDPRAIVDQFFTPSSGHTRGHSDDTERRSDAP